MKMRSPAEGLAPARSMKVMVQPGDKRSLEAQAEA